MKKILDGLISTFVYLIVFCSCLPSQNSELEGNFSFFGGMFQVLTIDTIAVVNV